MEQTEVKALVTKEVEQLELCTVGVVDDKLTALDYDARLTKLEQTVATYTAQSETPVDTAVTALQTETVPPTQSSQHPRVGTDGRTKSKSKSPSAVKSNTAKSGKSRPKGKGDSNSRPRRPPMIHDEAKKLALSRPSSSEALDLRLRYPGTLVEIAAASSIYAFRRRVVLRRWFDAKARTALELAEQNRPPPLARLPHVGDPPGTPTDAKEPPPQNSWNRYTATKVSEHGTTFLIDEQGRRHHDPGPDGTRQTTIPERHEMLRARRTMRVQSDTTHGHPDDDVDECSECGEVGQHMSSTCPDSLCPRCHGRGHLEANCLHFPCSNCGGRGHTADVCPSASQSLADKPQPPPENQSSESNPPRLRLFPNASLPPANSRCHEGRQGEYSGPSLTTSHPPNRFSFVLVPPF